jgi:uncharacterized membrane protein
MAVFAADHFVTARFVAGIIPSWIPWRLFWAYFVGVGLFAGALSLATTIRWRWAAALFALMFLIFELTMHIPNLVAVPHSKARLTLLLRDIPLLAGCLAFAASQSHEAARPGARSGVRSGALLRAPARFSPLAGRQLAARRLVAVACFLFAIPVAVFGVEHFLNPDFAPGIPQDNPALKIPMPSWLPAHVLWIYLTGSIFLLSAIAIITRRYGRTASVLIGATILVIIALVYIPLTIGRAADVDGGLNYLCIHFALAGSALMLAGALPSHSAALAGVPEMEPAGIDRVASS